MTCERCGQALSRDEEGLCRKLFGRMTATFLCYDCLAERMQCTTDKLKEMAERFREAGCTLFT